MIVLLTTMRLEPGHADDATDIVAALVESSRAHDGTVHYWATRDLLDPTVLRFVEAYEDPDAAEEHTRLDAYRAFVETLPEVVDGTIETHQFEVDDVYTAEFTAAEAVDSLE